MKKQAKKLVLSRETLRSLEGSEIQTAVGATGGGIEGSGCLFTCDTVYTCPHATSMCTTC